MPYTYEELSERLEKLPEDLREAIFGVETSQTLQDVGKKYSLHIDKLAELVNETGLVIVGITHPKDFIPHLVERLGVDKLTARNIAEDVNRQIFQKVRESLKKIHGLAEEPGTRNQEPEIKEEARPEIKKEATAPAFQTSIPKPELKPLEIRPMPPTPTETKPTQPLNHSTTQLPPGLAFEEKTKESIFRTPSETREKIEEKSFADIKKEIKNDPYRESIE